MLLRNTPVKYLQTADFGTGKLSLVPFVNYLQEIVHSPHKTNNLLPQFGLDRITEVEQHHGAIAPDNLVRYQSVLEMIHAMQHGLRLGAEELWGLGDPIPRQAFYGTEKLYTFLESETQLLADDRWSAIEPMQFLLYRVILERFYDIPGTDGNKLLYKVKKEEVDRYYELEVDFSFVNIRPLGELPVIDLAILRDKEVYTADDLKPVFQALDPRNFAFTGFTILTFQDKTIPYVSELLRSLIANLSQYKLDSFFEELHNILSTIAGSKNLMFSLLPVLELNGYPILPNDFPYDSIFVREIQKRKESGSVDPAIAAYLENPHPVLYGLEKSLDTAHPIFRKLIEQEGLTSYVCVPLKNTQGLVGFVELYSRLPHVLDKATMLIWRSFVPQLTQLVADVLFIFKRGLERIILHHYTAVDPAVEWRFNEVAATHLVSAMRRDKETPLEKIRFRKVYPLYGAVDVKDSTRLRNDIYRQRNLSKLDHLEDFLHALSRQETDPIVRRLVRQAAIARAKLEAENYDRYLQEVFLFLHEEVFQSFEQLKAGHPALTVVIDTFIRDKKDGMDNQSDIFEISLQQLNVLIKEEVRQFNEAAQAIFPSYFEMFRSDGIEYDLYVGQSITPTKAFDLALLREIRKKQLIAMARIGQRAAQAEQSLPVPMQVTLLVFVHGTTIDISFREDERHFDVEGGYNIRYQMVKKRIDKIRIKDSEERLVQPHKLAVVFQGSAVGKEVASLLQEVADEGFLTPCIESVILEEIQGVSELRAWRADVRLNESLKN